MEKDHQYLFIDFEFTMAEGKSKNNGFYPEIIEVGAIAVINDRIIDEYSAYVRPQKFPRLSERCKNFLGIKQNDIDSGVSFENFINKLASYDQGYPMHIVTWGNMDMKVLRQNCQMNGFPFPFKGDFVDFSMEYKRFFGDRNQTGVWKAVKEYGKDGFGKHHRAFDDAMTTYNVYKLVAKDKKYMEKHEPTTIGDLIDLKHVLDRFA